MPRVLDHDRSTRPAADRLAQLKRSVSILHLCAAHGIALRPHGRGDFVGHCPLPGHAKACPAAHDEASFIVTPRGNRWRCERCGRGGGLLGLLMRLDHLTRAQAVDRLLVHPGLIDRASQHTPVRQRSPREGGTPCRV